MILSVRIDVLPSMAQGTLWRKLKYWKQVRVWWSHLFQTEAFLCGRKGEAYGILRELEGSGGPSLIFTNRQGDRLLGTRQAASCAGHSHGKVPPVIILVGVGFVCPAAQVPMVLEAKPMSTLVHQITWKESFLSAIMFQYLW